MKAEVDFARAGVDKVHFEGGQGSLRASGRVRSGLASARKIAKSIV